MVQEERSTYLVTGATRGIGREIVKQLTESSSNAQIIAAVRNLDSALTVSFQADFPKAIIVKIDSEVDTDPFYAAKKLSSLGIKRIDTIFANAAKLITSGDADQTPADDLRDLFNVNAIAPLLLFQAFKPFLEASPSPKFVPISSVAASIAAQVNLPFKTVAYGTSKVALNFIAVRLAVENDKINTFVLSPGMVATDMASQGLESIGMTVDEALKNGLAITKEKSAKSIINLTNKATLADTQGKFFEATTGEIIAW